MHYNALPESGIFEEIAIELGVDPAFVEKDWYAVQVLRAIADIPPGPIIPVFSGGTCLSKAYKLSKRFSEDLDFRGNFIDGRASKSVRRTFRESVLAAAENINGINLDRNHVEMGSSFFKFPLSYTNLFPKPGALRQDLQVEFSYTQPKRDCETRPVSSFVATFSNAEPETQLPCLSPIETAADKLCALTWRILKRDRDSDDDDPAMIRQLHDLCA